MNVVVLQRRRRGGTDKVMPIESSTCAICSVAEIRQLIETPGIALPPDEGHDSRFDSQIRAYTTNMAVASLVRVSL
jgi:hypothetical protein